MSQGNSRSRGRRTALIPLAVALLTASPAFGAGFMSVQGGGFVPWQGDAGPSIALQLLGSSSTAKARFGGEFEYRGFDSTIIGVRDVGVDSYIIRAMWQQHFRPDAAVTPYLGLGLGVSVNVVDDHKVDRVRGGNTIDSTHAGIDGIFLLGVDAKLPGADYMSVYAEGRVGFGYLFAHREDANSLIGENVGGASGNLGLRFRF
jgi:hypothetical protein